MSTETDNNQNDDFAAFEQSVAKGNNESLSQDDEKPAKELAKEANDEPEASDDAEETPDEEPAKEAADEDDADDGDEPESSDDTEDDDSDTATVRKKVFDKRVKDLTFKRREAERQAAEKDEEIARLKKAMEEKGLTEDKEAVNEETDPRPDPIRS